MSNLTFSVITPSYNQLDWLRLCVASVRDQATACGGIDNCEFQIANSNQQSLAPWKAPRPVEALRPMKRRITSLGKLFHQGKHFPQGTIKNQESTIPTLRVEHIIQDAGTPGIEDFAREINADFYQDGHLVFEAVASNEWRVASGE